MATSYARLPWALVHIHGKMHRLPWFKAKWKKTLANRNPLVRASIDETDLLSHQ